MAPDELLLKLAETSLSGLVVFLMYRLAIAALNNKKNSQ